LSAWHKTDAITGDKGRDFLLFVYITHTNGNRHTLRLPLEPGTHDWQLAKTVWKPEGDIASATLYIGLARKTGTAWVDDVYLGPATPNDVKSARPRAQTADRQPGHVDTVPPVIILTTKPAIEQEGGLYFAVPDTLFSFETVDALSGVAAVEVSIDEGPYKPYAEPIRLPVGQHTLRCRATDRAGNQTDIITGDSLTGGETDTVRITVR
jgi:hypothetical protein